MKRVGFVLIAIFAMLSVFVASGHGQQSRSGSPPQVIASEFSAEVTGTVKNVNEKFPLGDWMKAKLASQSCSSRWSVTCCWPNSLRVKS